MFKKIALFIILLMGSVGLYAVSNDSKVQFYVFDDFSKGLNSHASIFGLDGGGYEKFCNEAQNIRFNSSFKSFSKRTVMINAYDFGSNDITSLHRYYKSDGTQGVISTYSTFVATADIAAANQVIKNGMSDGLKWTWITFKDFAIGMNGSDRPLKYDGGLSATANTTGHRTANNLATDLGCPFAELLTGAHLDASKWYSYKLGYTIDGLDYYCDGYSNAINTGAAVRDIKLTDIPLGPSGTTARVIFRTQDQATEVAAETAADTAFYTTTTISDNTTTTYSDTNTDAAISGADTFATFKASAIDCTPPLGKFSEIHKSRLWIAGNGTYPSRLYYSNSAGGGNPDYFGASDIFYIRENDGDKITGIENFLGMFNVFKTNSISKVYTSTTPWSIGAPLSQAMGCDAPYSIAVSPHGIYYLRSNNLYIFTGQASSLVSDAVTDIMNDISQIYIDSVVGVFFKNEYSLSYTSIKSGATDNNRVLVYDSTRNAYTLDIKDIDSFSAFSAGTDNGVLYLGSSNDDGIVWANEVDNPTLAKRLKSEIDLGTFDDTRTTGTENAPILLLGWDEIISALTGIISDLIGIVARPDTDGTWTSPIYRVDADTYSTLSWNERLNGSGDVTWAVRSAATSGGIAGATWSAEITSPYGSDMTGLTANNYIQLRASLSTSDIDFSPELFYNNGYVFKLLYSQSGSVQETSFASRWASGYNSLGIKGYKKRIVRINIHYRGDSGTFTFGYKNANKDLTLATEIEVDMSVSPSAEYDDNYFGTDSAKIFRYRPARTENPTGQYFQFTVEDESQGEFTIDKIEVAYVFAESKDL